VHGAIALCVRYVLVPPGGTCSTTHSAGVGDVLYTYATGVPVHSAMYVSWTMYSTSTIHTQNIMYSKKSLSFICVLLLKFTIHNNSNNLCVTHIHTYIHTYMKVRMKPWHLEEPFSKVLLAGKVV
jgi:hypothetical protein